MLTLVVGILFFVSTISQQTFAQDTFLTIKQTLERQGFGTYEQEQAEQLRILNEELGSCAATDYLANQTNFKVIEITEGIDPVSGSILKNEHCGNKINEYLENDYTIKGALQDKGELESSYIILEKIK